MLYDQKGSNSQIVRCASFNATNGQIVSGGEDGILNVWLPGEGKEVTSNNPMVDIPTRKTHKQRSNKPYSKR